MAACSVLRKRQIAAELGVACVYLDVDCPKCNVVTTFDVPAREAGRTDYPVQCPSCQAKFELWLDPQWFM